jgi:hypothetical protein
MSQKVDCHVEQQLGRRRDLAVEEMSQEYNCGATLVKYVVVIPSVIVMLRH